MAAQVGHILNQTTDFKEILQSRAQNLIDQITLPTILASTFTWAILGANQAMGIVMVYLGYRLLFLNPLSMLSHLPMASQQGILMCISLIVFFVTEILPGDTATFILGQRATPENLAALRNQLGLNQPIHQRYIAWITGLLQGDWGNSLLLKIPVLPILTDRLYNSAILAGLALYLAYR